METLGFRHEWKEAITVSSSKFPVGSYASRISTSDDNTRAIATPPHSDFA